MVDTLSPERRSALMARIGSKNTKPELIVRRLLHGAGWRYRLHNKGLPGTPDLVFSARKAVLFVHGCFWHGHSCRLARLPKTRSEFWAAKQEANRERDSRKTGELVRAGWRVMTIWQCALKEPEQLLVDMDRFLASDTQLAETDPVGAEKGN